MLAQNLDQFSEIACSALQEALNSEAGQELTQELLTKQLERKPDTTPEEWQKIKQQFFLFCFCEAIKADGDLMKEYGTHIYNELKGGGKND